MSAAIGAMIVAAAAARGADPARLMAATGFDPALASNPDAKISLALEAALWAEAARMTSDDAFGLHAAELVKPGMFDVLDYAVRTAPTLRISLERLARYNRLVHDAAVFELVPDDAVVRVEHDFRAGSGAQSRHSAEFTLASLAVVATQLAGEPVRPRAVAFAHSEPARAETLAEHRRIFGLKPQFGCPRKVVAFDARVLDRPLPQADRALSRVIERHAEALLAQLPALHETTAERVRNLLWATLGEQVPTLGELASRLKTSERSLQRKLAEEKLTFELLLDQVRRDLALRYLADPKIAVAEIAYLLGYSEPSPFHRAFKRWTGLTPNEARRSVA
jgi:AraC-like DNA-binding protein